MLLQFSHWCSVVSLAVFLLQLSAGDATAQTSPVADFEQLSPSDWPWWRGPNRDGHAATAQVTSLPAEFGPEQNIVWKTPIPGRGHSSPIAVGRTIFLTTADEQTETQSVIAVGLDDGQMQWTTVVNQGEFPANNHPKNTEASATLASDGKLLFATFFHHKQIELIALNLDGSIAWKKSAGRFDPKMFEYGYAPSPALYGELVIIAAEHDGVSYLAGFARDSGREVWRTPRRASISFSSPVIANVAGRDQLLISGQGKVSAYDPSNGNELWSVEGTTAATCGTMIWTGDTVFASGGYPKAETIAVRAEGSGKVVWSNNQKCYEQSMIVVDGYVYALTDNGIAYCWQASDGKEMWRERLSGPVSASPVFADGKIFWSNEAGTFYVFMPNPQHFELVAENKLGDESFASPAIVANSLLLRIAEKNEQAGQAARQEFLIRIAQE